MEETDDRGRKTRTTEAKDQRRGIPQGSPISPLAGESVHAPVCVGVEEARAGAAPWHSHRDLRRRSRDPVPEGQGGRSLATTARDHGQTEADGQRGEDTNLQGPGRRVRLPGLHVRADVFAATGKAHLGLRPSKKSIRRMVEKIHAMTANVDDVARDHGAGGQVEPHVARLGELLPSRHRQPRLPCDRRLHADAVAPVVAPQVQGTGDARRGLSTLAPLRDNSVSYG